jgi:hypothetical protein
MISHIAGWSKVSVRRQAARSKTYSSFREITMWTDVPDKRRCKGELEQIFVVDRRLRSKTNSRAPTIPAITEVACWSHCRRKIFDAWETFANRANLLTITGGHTIDALCYCLGEFRELAAFVVSQRDRILVEETGELIAKTVPDQLVVNGIVGDGTVVSF